MQAGGNMWNFNNQQLPSNSDGPDLSQQQQEQQQQDFQASAFSTHLGDPLQFFSGLLSMPGALAGTFPVGVGDLSNMSAAQNFGHLQQHLYADSAGLNGNFGGTNRSFQLGVDSPDVTRMSSPSQTSQSNTASRLELDARAAELKEQLLRSRSQRDRYNSASPALEGSKMSNLVPPRQPSVGVSSDRGKATQTTFVPHPLPRQPSQTSVPADANDIAALINSISSTTQEQLAAAIDTTQAHLEEEKMPANQLARPMSSMSIMPTPSSSQTSVAAPKHTNAESPVAEKVETPKILASSTTSAAAAIAATAAVIIKPMAAPKQSFSPMEEGEISSSPPLSPAVEKTAEKKGVAGKATVAVLQNLPTEPRAARLASSLKKKAYENNSVKSSSSPATFAAPQRGAEPSKAPPHYEPRYRTGPDSGPSLKGDNMPKSNKLVNKNDQAKAPEPAKKKNEELNNLSGAKAESGSSHQTTGSNPNAHQAEEESNHAAPATSEETLRRLLDRDPDLRDWLNITDYFNTELRTRKLERYRRNLSLEAELQRLQAEKQKLLEEEESEMVFIRRPTATPVVGGFPAPAPAPTPVLALAPAPALAPTSTGMVVAGTETGQTQHTPASNHHAPQNVVPPSEPLGPAKVVPAKREYEEHEDSARARSDKMPRTDDQQPRNEEPEIKSGEGSHRGEREPPATFRKYHARPGPPSRDSSPHRPFFRGSSPPPPSRYDSYRRSPGPPGPPPPRRSFSPHRNNQYPVEPRASRVDYEHFDESFRPYDDYRSEEGRRGRAISPPRGPQLQDKKPIHVDLGRKGDTRFFIVKSFNEDNVRKCMEDGIWVTQVQNGHIFASAFKECQHVILFFSINKSRAFQGYARMKTPPSQDTPRSKWMSGLHWDTSPPFRVEWLSTTPVQFYRIRHLKNNLNEGEAVLVGKDGQEVDEECGRGLLYEMESYAAAITGGESFPVAPRFPSKKFIKRDDKSERW